MSKEQPYPTAEPFIPERPTIPKLRAASTACRDCDLWKSATQTVFGEGPARGKVMLVGEQPGDKEDESGHPFVGPAGGVLDEALERIGLPRSETYVTNIVKHFKWEPRGKRRIHLKPRYGEIVACRPWLDWEIRLVKPRVIVCLGATAAQGLLGAKFRVTRQRGEWISSPLAEYVMATVHPSSILRQVDREKRHQENEAFVADLRKVAAILAA